MGAGRANTYLEVAHTVAEERGAGRLAAAAVKEGDVVAAGQGCVHQSAADKVRPAKHQELHRK